ncbi:hypothetical protein [Dactylosporangium maewongense]|uniref:hypothetical protein n=1 Tax=Dactylosporangium maewongense TaxID=634393 RepID=UPI0031D297F8
MLRRITAPRQQRDAGSTVNEMLVAAVVVAALGAIAVTSVGDLTGKSRSTACEADKRAVEIAYQAYVADENAKPAAVGDLVTAGYLNEEPPAANGITLDAAGTVTATAC